MDDRVYMLLGEINGKLDGIMREQRRLAEEQIRSTTSHDARISKMEVAYARVLGWASGVAMGVSALVSVVFKLFFE